MLCFEYFISRISILDCVTSPGYNLHFTERVRGALPLRRHYLISPPCGPLGEMGSGMLGKRQQKSGFSLRNVTQAWALVQKWTPESIVGLPSLGNYWGGSPFISLHPLFLSHTVGASYLPVGVLFFVFLSLAISLIPQHIPNPFRI